MVGAAHERRSWAFVRITVAMLLVQMVVFSAQNTCVRHFSSIHIRQEKPNHVQAQTHRLPAALVNDTSIKEAVIKAGLEALGPPPYR